MFVLSAWPAGPRLIAICAALVFAGGQASADNCPASPDHSAPLEALITQVQQADDEATALQISNQMWEFWADAPNEQAQAVLDRGMSRRSGYDFTGALEDFDILISYCPAYAEGYNQRAFVHFLRQDFAAALTDLDRALELSPRHVAALSGRALALLGLSRTEEARIALKTALALNPWLPERGLIAPGGPLATVPVEEIEL
ncbi:tetratricopeptide repeat protein [Parasedimentitalea marina]|uniref:Tetratricopeptide repeat protein n=1 Tax=Parasedimentitalea marina TaxID=2483033 RepID=A0A3T0N417_9RHOB|nr:tetratricopeptide repeat protein [Parasedimentitalea marina]AZV78776.1 tetratricopeptide repeat protein [Parasedimentitalea marina]